VACELRRNALPPTDFLCTKVDFFMPPQVRKKPVALITRQFQFGARPMLYETYPVSRSLNSRVGDQKPARRDVVVFERHIEEAMDVQRRRRFGRRRFVR